MRAGPLFLFLVVSASVASAAKVRPNVVERVRTSGRARVIALVHDTNADGTGSGLAVVDRLPRAGVVVGDLTADGIEKLQTDPNVISVDLDIPGGGGDDESLPLIGGNTVHDLGFYGDGVVVAVLDTGFDSAHVDLAGAVIDEACFCRNSDGSGCCPNAQTSQIGPGAAKDDHGHGTNVTGIIASRGTIAPIGIAPRSRVVAVKVLDRLNRFSGVSQVISGLEWVLTNHPETRVVNMSLLTDSHFEGYCDDAASFAVAAAQIIRALRTNGTAVFACSGNTASAKALGLPACIEATISVGAVFDATLSPMGGSVCSDPAPRADQITCFTDSNATLDLLAPGALITSTGLNRATSTFAGTSQASPHAAGSAAVLFGVKPALSVDVAEAILKTTGKPIVDSRNGITIPRIDVLAAVQKAQIPAPRKRSARH